MDWCPLADVVLLKTLGRKKLTFQIIAVNLPVKTF